MPSLQAWVRLKANFACAVNSKDKVSMAKGALKCLWVMIIMFIPVAVVQSVGLNISHTRGFSMMHSFD